MQESTRKTGRKGQRGPKGQRPLAFKLKVAKAYVFGDESLQQVAVRYGIGRKAVYDWSHRFYGELSINQTTGIMTEAEQKEFEALKKQNQDLKKQLEYADMKATAFEIMIEIAEKQLGVDIKKKPGTKQP
jgi:transposase